MLDQLDLLSDLVSAAGGEVAGVNIKKVKSPYIHKELYYAYVTVFGCIYGADGCSMSDALSRLIGVVKNGLAEKAAA